MNLHCWRVLSHRAARALGAPRHAPHAARIACRAVPGWRAGLVQSIALAGGVTLGAALVGAAGPQPGPAGVPGLSSDNSRFGVVLPPPPIVLPGPGGLPGVPPFTWPPGEEGGHDHDGHRHHHRHHHDPQPVPEPGTLALLALPLALLMAARWQTRRAVRRMVAGED